MPKATAISGDQPKPSSQHRLCKCHKNCGGPDGVGLWVSRSSKYRHKAADIMYLVRRNASLGNLPMIGALPFTPADDSDDSEDTNSVSPTEHEPTGDVEPTVPNTIDNDIPINNPMPNPSEDDCPVAEEEDYEPPDPDNLGDNEYQQNPPEQNNTATPETDYTPPPTVESTIREFRIAEDFIRELQNATINGPEAEVEPLPTDFVERL
ncbi:hypothetical protein AAF712_008261 [Marasmius tenuissimus]|uniref:Uncharacterized protein n=1 Tax=Marasmius tenuissimus TaxID=585030 RepID=A0ABR2ZUK0_9AGAR